jgi:hypothetical protein
MRAGEGKAPVGAYIQRQDCVVMTCESTQLLSILHVPELEGAVVRAGQRTTTVGGERSRKDHALVASEGVKRLAGLQVPESQRPVA